MKEYWINVYDLGYIWYGTKYCTRSRAEYGVGKLTDKLLYRIHVRLK